MTFVLLFSPLWDKSLLLVFVAGNLGIAPCLLHDPTQAKAVGHETVS